MEQLNFFENLGESNKPICPFCGNSFEKNNSKQVYCSTKCHNKVYSKSYYEANKDKRKVYDKAYKERNKDKISKKRRLYRKANKDKIKEYGRVYTKNKYKTDINFKFRKNIRRRILKTIKGERIDKSNDVLKLLGCSITEAKNHLEKQFKEGMSWENYGYKTWHIDHIIPCASFDLADPEQQKKCFHYTNLQPLWAHENLSKGAKTL